MAKTKKRGVSRLKTRFRVSVFNDTSHEEMFIFRASGLMVLVITALTVIFLIGSVTVLISFTPLREFIPGYPNAQTRNAIIQNALRADSLEQSIRIWDFHLHNIQRIVSGKEPLDPHQIAQEYFNSDSTKLSSEIKFSGSDSILREEVRREELAIAAQSGRKIEQIEGIHFFPPVKGVISEYYNVAINHPYIDIAAPENSAVSAVLDGTIIFAAWTEETGYTIQIQHENDLISIYKHNAKLLKKSGEKVKAGTAIALIGNTGTLSSGNHLHFELWHKGVPIDPVKYIKF